jgi:hypothetical protein
VRRLMDRNRHSVAGQISSNDEDRNLPGYCRRNHRVDLPQSRILRDLATKQNLGEGVGKEHLRGSGELSVAGRENLRDRPLSGGIRAAIHRIVLIFNRARL